MTTAFHVCSRAMRKIFEFNATYEIEEKPFFERVLDLSTDKKSIFRTCVWAGRSTDCNMFKYVMTERGPCYSFNVLNSNKTFTNK